MDLKSQKQIAARVLKCGVSRVRLDPGRNSDIADAITAADVRRLVRDGIITAAPKRGLSSYRARVLMKQKTKGRRRSTGSRKGRVAGTRKRAWVKRIRTIRVLLKQLRDEGKLEKKTFRKLYMISKSGMFRSKAHLTGYMEKNNMLKK
ncbi:MAG: 50S ribosomal protein L19e [Candidatus Aenigmarchaeota archaeon]|nr:50S ribosomal protein L19e [Candidatus Aenigmarchaeota archaeon]